VRLLDGLGKRLGLQCGRDEARVGGYQPRSEAAGFWWVRVANQAAKLPVIFISRKYTNFVLLDRENAVVCHSLRVAFSGLVVTETPRGAAQRACLPKDSSPFYDRRSAVSTRIRPGPDKSADGIVRRTIRRHETGIRLLTPDSLDQEGPVDMRIGTCKPISPDSAARSGFRLSLLPKDRVGRISGESATPAGVSPRIIQHCEELHGSTTQME